MSSFERIDVNERIYMLERFNPMQGLEYSAQLLSVVGPALGGLAAAGQQASAVQVFSSLTMALKGPECAELLKTALRRCKTPQNESLENMAAFELWFSQHPEDMFELGAVAMVKLVSPFLPQRLRTLLSEIDVHSLTQAEKTS
jgi:hypothetical protein